ncbi:hypothetical protein MMH89_01390 [Candidatus Comchoanobacter bicostacola]|uniref:Uncharacterized protein n=1 Tax=Candidatus Comchoanobacter bicostacola TaxID=2919598 RepID=A0ABY5DMH9_9GAMM|nr:hypothetical protein [Candidatus Comchoanobacter bicostacola]UTC24805.1 hypothetical protein MMH89_01390 [Candidatus Comchoanobacter bicostacola]
MELKSILALSLLMSASSVHAYNINDAPTADNGYTEFLQTINIAGRDLKIDIPTDYDLAIQQNEHNQQTLGFVPDNETQDDWTELLTISIDFNSSISASERVEQIKEYLEREHKDSSKIRSSSDNVTTRDGRSYQVSQATFQFSDEESPISSAITCYTDHTTLVCAQAHLRSSKPSMRTASRAQKIINNIMKVD